MAPPRTIRIGLLICGVFSDAVKQAHGDFYELYSSFWKNTILSGCNAKVVVEGFQVRNMEFPDEKRLKEFDLFTVTGSLDSAYDDTIPWIKKLVPFIRNLIENHPKVKLAGFCFGHQIICRALGGDSIHSEHWEIGPSLVNLSDVGRSIFGVDRLVLQEIHGDIVPLRSLFKQLASGELYLVGSSDITDNQGIVKFYPSSGDAVKTPRDIHVLTLQGHPELDEVVITRITRQIIDIIDTPALNDYWGFKGGFYDDEPSDKEGTGRRWWKTDGVEFVSTVYWKMLGVSPSFEASGFVGKESATRVSQKSAVLSVGPLKVERDGKAVSNGWWRLSSGFKFISKVFMKIIGVAIRRRIGDI